MNLLSTFILTTGIWRAALMTPGGELPFMMKVDYNDSAYTFTIINGKDELEIDEIEIKGDSLIAVFPVYESALRLKVISNDRVEGEFHNLTRSTHARIPMYATAGNQPRFYIDQSGINQNSAGTWAVTFDPGKPDSSFAVGKFEQNGSLVSGTFLTPSGDYNFLEGTLSGDSLFLSTFNGVFVYLFKAKITGDKISGTFYSGTHRQIPFLGFRDSLARLPDAETVTTFRNTEEGFRLRFPDTDSNMVSLSDPRFKNKVVVIQIMGSWCPNCLDESKFLGPFYDENKDKGFEIIGLSFEKTDDFMRAAANVDRFRNRLRINYTLLVASNRDKIRQTLPSLENFVGFPTTIFLDKNRKVRKVHAGFTGEAAGIEHEAFKKSFTDFIGLLLAE